MFEEVQQLCTEARFKACQRQCRIAKCLNGGSIFDGNCTCERLIECMCSLHKLIPEDFPLELDEVFPDIRTYWKVLWDESNEENK